MTLLGFFFSNLFLYPRLFFCVLCSSLSIFFRVEREWAKYKEKKKKNCLSTLLKAVMREYMVFMFVTQLTRAFDTRRCASMFVIIRWTCINKIIWTSTLISNQLFSFQKQQQIDCYLCKTTKSWIEVLRQQIQNALFTEENFFIKNEFLNSPHLY